MKAPTEYTVMGEDGKEYGPVDAKQVREWVAEGRLDKKTPIKPADARDWIFLGEVEEFTKLFAPPRTPKVKIAPRKGLIKAFVVLTLVTTAYYLFLHHRHH
jgi:hypothetical protein